jgi:hypothetical protein
LPSPVVEPTAKADAVVAPKAGSEVPNASSCVGAVEFHHSVAQVEDSQLFPFHPPVAPLLWVLEIFIFF